jgi:type II secretory pathway component PulM
VASDTRTERASLGCGSLLLIIMALMFFFRPGITDLEREVRNLRSEVGELKNAIDAQSIEIRALREKAEKSKVAE